MDARAALRLLLADTGLQVAEADGYTITLNTIIPRDNRVASTGVVAQVAPPQSPPQSQPQPPAETTTESADVRNLDTVTVTGSFIRRIDTETALPVTTLGQEEIDLSGASTVSDMRGQLPKSAGFANSEASTGTHEEMGSGTCRERVGESVAISEGARALK